MLIHALSDLHLEFGPYTEPVPECDVVILAGDTDVKTRGPAWARAHFGDREILYVPGNHEYYGSSIPREDGKLREASEAVGVRFLQMDEVVLGGVRFLGATLWTDHELNGNPLGARFAHEQQMNDCRRIRVGPSFSQARALDFSALHARHRSWLEERLSEPFSGPSVVITHHAPIRQPRRAHIQPGPLDAAYASDLRDLISRHSPHLWIYGHTHRAAILDFADTRLVTNARGYAGEEEVAAFAPDLVLEVE